MITNIAPILRGTALYERSGDLHGGAVITKIINVFLALLFVVFAWFQHNDIDPAVYFEPSTRDAVLWLLFYALIAVLFIVVIFRRIPTWVLLVATVACFVEMGRSGPGLWENLFGNRDFSMTQTSMSAEDPRVELTREFFGALIALLGVALIWWQSSRKGRVGTIE